MRAVVGLWSALTLFLLMEAVIAQGSSGRNSTRKPQRKPLDRKASPMPGIPEPQEPTDFPPPIFGPPSIFPDCPRECSCDPSHPSALNCENRNLRKVPVIPARTHYLYLQNNYISEVTAEAFANATELRWVNLANNRIQRVDKEVFAKIPSLIYLYLQKNQLKQVPSAMPVGLEQLRLGRNRITRIPPGAFQKMERLVLLDLYSNQLSDSGLGKNTFRGLSHLIQLNLARNVLKKMPAGVPASVIQLFLDRNSIEDIPKQVDTMRTHTNRQANYQGEKMHKHTDAQGEVVMVFHHQLKGIAGFDPQ